MIGLIIALVHNSDERRFQTTSTGLNRNLCFSPANFSVPSPPPYGLSNIRLGQSSVQCFDFQSMSFRRRTKRMVVRNVHTETTRLEQLAQTGGHLNILPKIWSLEMYWILRIRIILLAVLCPCFQLLVFLYYFDDSIEFKKHYTNNDGRLFSLN